MMYLLTQCGYRVHQVLRKCPNKNAPPVFRNKLLLTIFVSFEAIISKPHIHVEKMNKNNKKIQIDR